MARKASQAGTARHRQVRVHDPRWKRFVELAGKGQCSSVINDFIAWFTGEPGAELPVRPVQPEETTLPTHPDSEHEPPTTVATQSTEDGQQPPPAPLPNDPFATLAASFAGFTRAPATVEKKWQAWEPRDDAATDVELPEDAAELRALVAEAVQLAVNYLPPGMATVLTVGLLDLLAEREHGGEWTNHQRRALAAARELIAEEGES